MPLPQPSPTFRHRALTALCLSLAAATSLFGTEWACFCHTTCAVCQLCHHLALIAAMAALLHTTPPFSHAPWDPLSRRVGTRPTDRTNGCQLHGVCGRAGTHPSLRLGYRLPTPEPSSLPIDPIHTPAAIAAPRNRSRPCKPPFPTGAHTRPSPRSCGAPSLGCALTGHVVAATSTLSVARTRPPPTSHAALLGTGMRSASTRVAHWVQRKAAYACS